MRTLPARFTTHALALAVGVALPALAAATPPIDQFGSLAYSCAGASSGNGVPVQSIDLGSRTTP
jgi:hypothetical protein